MSSQMGKDVVKFLAWAAEPEMEERKLVIPYLIIKKNSKEHMCDVELVIDMLRRKENQIETL